MTLALWVALWVGCGLIDLLILDDTELLLKIRGAGLRRRVAITLFLAAPLTLVGLFLWTFPPAAKCILVEIKETFLDVVGRKE